MTELRRVVLLHRLPLPLAQRDALLSAGLEVIVTRTFAQAEAQLQRGGDVIVVVDLAHGGAAPERIARICATRPATRLLACRSKPGGRGSGRASRLGIEHTHAYPDELFGALLQALGVQPRFSLRRSAVRVPVGGVLLGDLQGILLNLSSGGALVEAGDAPTGSVLTATLSVPGLAEQVDVRARVCWRESLTDGRARLGLQFVTVPDSTRRAVEEYVQRSNATRTRPAARSSPSESVSVRQDGQRRQDWFELQRSGPSELLVPRRQFFVPWSLGDHLWLRERGAAERRVRVVERLLLEPDRVDGRVAWLVSAADLTSQEGSP